MAKKKNAKKKSRVKVSRTQKTSPKKSAKKSAKKKSSSRKIAAKSAGKRSATTRIPSQKPVRTKQQIFDSASAGLRRRQSQPDDADSDGLSNVERADSESVGELLDEGNSFEAGIVKGVEEADDADEREVRTREVPEDDVPQEYLDEE